MKENSNSISIQKLKDLALLIADQQEQKYGIKININPMTVVEYYKSDIFKKDLIVIDDNGYKMIDLSVLRFPFMYNAFYEIDRKDIIVFIRNFNKKIKANSDLLYIDFIISIYHEIKHQLQYKDRENIKKLELSTFMFDIELLVQYFNPKFYNEHHGEIFMEIEANLYGVDCTLEYLKNNNLLFPTVKEHLQLLKNAYETDLKNYDFQKFLRLFNQIIMSNNSIERDELPGWTEIFYNSDKTIKTIDQILSHEDITHVDSRFLDAFFSSKHFLENINFKGLTYNNQKIIMKAIKNTYSNELIRQNSINKAFETDLIDKKTWLELVNDVSFNIAYYINTMYVYSNYMMKNNPENIKEIEKQYLIK